MSWKGGRGRKDIQLKEAVPSRMQELYRRHSAAWRGL